MPLQPDDRRLLTVDDAAALANDDPAPPNPDATAGSSDETSRSDHGHPGGGVFTFYGDGSDGDIVLDGVTDYTGLARTGSVYVAQQELCANDLTINEGVILRPSGQRINVLGVLSGDGDIIADTGKTSASGSGSSFTQMLAGGVGAAGATGAGGNGVNPSTNTSTNSNSGAGGSANGGGTAGGNSITQNAVFITGGRLTKRLRDPITAFCAIVFHSDWSQTTPSVTANLLAGGPSGGAGAGDGTNAGGKGGNGGQVVIVNARRIRGNVNISAPAENGGAAAGGNAGGGGGGGGGTVILNTTDTDEWTGALSAPAGTGGAKAGTGVAGGNGTAGVTRLNLWK
jgi:hypothetical protein